MAKTVWRRFSKQGKMLSCSLVLLGICAFTFSAHSAGSKLSSSMQGGWPRDSYTGPGGGLNNGPDGGLYAGPGGGASTGPGGGLSTGVGGGLSEGPGGGLSTGAGGGLSSGPGGGLYSGPGGGLSTGPRGGLSTAPGGGLCTGPSDEPYYSTQPPRPVMLKYLKDHGYQSAYVLLKGKWGL